MMRINDLRDNSMHFLLLFLVWWSFQLSFHLFNVQGLWTLNAQSWSWSWLTGKWSLENGSMRWGFHNARKRHLMFWSVNTVYFDDFFDEFRKQTSIFQEKTTSLLRLKKHWSWFLSESYILSWPGRGFQGELVGGLQASYVARWRGKIVGPCVYRAEKITEDFGTWNWIICFC